MEALHTTSFPCFMPFSVVCSGLYWLDMIDHYVTNYTVLLDGLLEAVAVAWVWAFVKDKQKVLLQGMRHWTLRAVHTCTPLNPLLKPPFFPISLNGLCTGAVASQVNYNSAMWFAWTYAVASAAFIVLSAGLSPVFRVLAVRSFAVCGRPRILL